MRKINIFPRPKKRKAPPPKKASSRLIPVVITATGGPEPLERQRRVGGPPRLSISERNALLDYLARYAASVARRKMKEDFNCEVSSHTTDHYLRRYRGEIGQRREAYLNQLRGEPLAYPRIRLREYIHQYLLCLLAMHQEVCPDCLGKGTVTVLDPKARPIPGRLPATTMARCPSCAGRKYILPDAAKALTKDLNGDVRLDTLPAPPPNISGYWMERAEQLLQRIREECGDAWSPKEKSSNGLEVSEQHVHLHGPAGIEALALLKQLLNAPPEQIVAIYQARTATSLPRPALPEPLLPQGGDNGRSRE